MGDRIHSIDAARAVAMAAIVAIHAEPFAGLGPAGNAAHFAIDAISRFAVPFFFLTAGYLFAVKVARSDSGAYVRRYAARVGSIYIFGLLLYVPLVLLEAAGEAALEGGDVQAAVVSRAFEAASPLGVLYYGDSVLSMLWFLPALVYSIVLVYCFERGGLGRYLVPVALGFHVVGLLGESYPMVLDVPLETRDALLFGFFYTALGFRIRTAGRTAGDGRSGLLLAGFLAFSALTLLERYALGYVIGDATFAGAAYTAEYSALTPLVAVSLFLFVLSKPELGAGTRLPHVGRYAVGIYVVHPLVLYSLVAASEVLATTGPALQATIGWHLVLTPVAYVGALKLYLAAAQRGLVDPGGSHLLLFRRDRRGSAA